MGGAIASETVEEGMTAVSSPPCEATPLLDRRADWAISGLIDMSVCPGEGMGAISGEAGWLSGDGERPEVSMKKRCGRSATSRDGGSVGSWIESRRLGPGKEGIPCAVGDEGPEVRTGECGTTEVRIVCPVLVL